MAECGVARTPPLECLNLVDRDSDLHFKLCDLEGQAGHLPGLSFLICKVGQHLSQRVTARISPGWCKLAGVLQP